MEDTAKLKKAYAKYLGKKENGFLEEIIWLHSFAYRMLVRRNILSMLYNIYFKWCFFIYIDFAVDQK